MRKRYLFGANVFDGIGDIVMEKYGKGFGRVLVFASLILAALSGIGFSISLCSAPMLNPSGCSSLTLVECTTVAGCFISDPSCAGTTTASCSSFITESKCTAFKCVWNGGGGGSICDDMPCTDSYPDGCCSSSPSCNPVTNRCESPAPALPDLVPGGAAPANADLGSSFTVQVDTVNSGSSNAGSSTTRVTFPGNPAVDLPVGSLAAGERQSNAVALSCSVAGTSYVSITVDVADTVPSEESESNNGLVLAVNCMPVLLPDYGASIVSAPASVQLGSVFTVVFSTSNTGTGAAASNSATTIVFPGNAPYDYNVLPLPPGSSNTAGISLGCSVPGSHILNVIADSASQLSESDEGNNWVARTVDCLAAPKPDYTVTMDAPASANVGSSFSVTVHTHNTGLASATQNSLTRVRFPGNADYNQPISGLPAGTTSTAGRSFLCASAGQYVLNATADTDNMISESNEGNNGMTAVVACIQPAQPDYVVSVASPSTVTIGGTFAVRINTTNAGAGDAAAPSVTRAAFAGSSQDMAVAALHAGRSQADSAEFSCASAGDFTLTITADAPPFAVAEDNEGNNAFAAIVNCNAPPSPPQRPAISSTSGTFTENSIASCSNCPLSASDPDAGDIVTLDYQWYRNGAVAGPWGSATSFDCNGVCAAGDSISLKARACDNHGTCTESELSIPISIPGDIVGGASSYMAIALVAAFAILALAYMASYVFSLPQMRAIVQDEIVQLVATGAVALLILGFNSSVDNYLSVTLNYTYYHAPGAPAPPSTMMGAAKFKIDYLITQTSSGLSEIEGASMALGREASKGIFCNFLGVGFTLVNCSQLNAFRGSLTTAAFATSMALADSFAQQFLLSLARSYAFTFLIPLGLFLRCFKTSRRAGGALIAVGFGFYTVYPTVLVATDSVLHGNAPPIMTGTCAGSITAADCSAIDLSSCENVIGCSQGTAPCSCKGFAASTCNAQLNPDCTWTGTECTGTINGCTRPICTGVPTGDCSQYAASRDLCAYAGCQWTGIPTMGTCQPAEPDVQTSLTEFNNYSAALTNFAIVENMTYFVLVRVLFLSILNLIITLGFIRAFAHIIGSEIDVASLARIS